LVSIPKRGELVTELKLCCRVKPLQRPRGRAFGKFVKMYQPKENQQELLEACKSLNPIGIDYPVIIDTYINFPLKGKNEHPTGPHYGDDDNLRKAISDALQANSVLSDDRWVLGGENYKSWGDIDQCLVRIWRVDGIKRIRA